jgi:hypothetical protein
MQVRSYYRGALSGIRGEFIDSGAIARAQNGRNVGIGRGQVYVWERNATFMVQNSRMRAVEQGVTEHTRCFLESKLESAHERTINY